MRFVNIALVVCVSLTLVSAVVGWGGRVEGWLAPVVTDVGVKIVDTGKIETLDRRVESLHLSIEPYTSIMLSFEKHDGWLTEEAEFRGMDFTLDGAAVPYNFLGKHAGSREEGRWVDVGPWQLIGVIPDDMSRVQMSSRHSRDWRPYDPIVSDMTPVWGVSPE